jgi:hypothetical protein
MNELQQGQDLASRRIDVITPAERMSQFVDAVRRTHRAGAKASLLLKLASQLQDEVSKLNEDIASGSLTLDGIAPESLPHLQEEVRWIADMLTGTQARMDRVELLGCDVQRQLGSVLAASQP